MAKKGVPVVGHVGEGGRVFIPDKEKLNLSESSASDLSSDISIKILDLGIFLDAGMRAIEEANEAVGAQGWKEVNATLVLLQHAKENYDCLYKEFNTLHNYLDVQSLKSKNR
ncbi:MAG: hypothetical protein WC581_03690 [Thermodesulfovibrionales bacterium]